MFMVRATSRAHLPEEEEGHSPPQRQAPPQQGQHRTGRGVPAGVITGSAARPGRKKPG